ncbi:type I glyceraldehyde-3-phosphate dehydrogenase [Candidatus Campbellbacteria bacterium RIFCSPLOWO2_02_35_12]|uniref:Type I glyceraldehyde-3-phosphate dehydrogenase n=1 Tax=Candidatus Campbellbacteria bacterium RIFCSPLOWO2_02_35_12 TaxID=1797580 RepID=A0A1F5EGH8_9BACT|nr:MAG: type I glyceraldehyde-3-phosphate dehydrogenase [Candidatus Campbellbacteria bacterium RIFCSPLOWO2_02_35_12]
MKKIRIAINGLGRIGRAFLRLAKDTPELELVAVNDIGDIENIAYLLKYDSVYGKNRFDVSATVIGADGNSSIIFDGKKIKFLSEREPSNLPWKNLDIDIVVESTGVFSSYEKSKAHLDAGAKRVVITAPVKDSPPRGISGETILMGVNEDKLKICDISSNGSCTTNAESPILAILNEKIGIEKALLNTIHSYTATQSIIDALNKSDVRRGRAAAINIVPSTTGAASATIKAMPELEGKFDGIALRVPVISGSIADITFITKKNTNIDEVNGALIDAANEERWKGIFTTTKEPLVSSDIIGNTYGAIADLSFTKVVGGNLVKVLSWYDNEVGYANTLVKHIILSGKYIK